MNFLEMMYQQQPFYLISSWLFFIFIFNGLNSCVVNSFRFGISAFSPFRYQNQCKVSCGSSKIGTCLPSTASSVPFNQASVQNPSYDYNAPSMYYRQSERQLMYSMKDAYEKKSFTLFLHLFSLFASKVKKSSQYINFKERKDLLFMSTTFVSSSDQCTGVEIVALLSCFAECRFSAKNNQEREFLNNLRKAYLRKSRYYNGFFIITYLKSIAGLQFPWERMGVEDENAMITLIEKASEDKEITPEFYYHLISSISRIDIPWNSLTNKTQSNLLERMQEMTSHIDLAPKSRFVYAFSLIKFLNFSSIPESTSGLFLGLIKDCLQCYHHNVKEPGKQVID
jgi:hypothetical protein